MSDEHASEWRRRRARESDDDAWLHVCMCVRVSALSTVLPTQQRLTKCSQRTATSIKHAICFKIKCCSRLHIVRIFRLITKQSGSPRCLCNHTYTHWQRLNTGTGTYSHRVKERERERLSSRDTGHTNRRRVDVGSGTCVWCVFVCNHACVYGCVRVFVVCLNFLALSLSLSLSSSHSHTRISLFATSLRFSYCCCCCYCCYYYNYLLIQYLELSTAFINSCSWLVLSPLSLLSLTLTLTHTLPIACTAEILFCFFIFLLHFTLVSSRHAFCSCTPIVAVNWLVVAYMHCICICFYVCIF